MVSKVFELVTRTNMEYIFFKKLFYTQRSACNIIEHVKNIIDDQCSCYKEIRFSRSVYLKPIQVILLVTKKRTNEIRKKETFSVSRRTWFGFVAMSIKKILNFNQRHRGALREKCPNTEFLLIWRLFTQ